jgi:hypothetical protein
MVGSVAAPLLAGFSITIVAVSLTDFEKLRWPGPAAILGVLTSGILVLTVQLTAWARQYHVTPADLRSWFDDADEISRRKLLIDELEFFTTLENKYARLARLTYSAGIVCLFAALGTAIAPTANSFQIVARWVAATIAYLFAAAEVGWILISIRKAS